MNASILLFESIGFRVGTPIIHTVPISIYSCPALYLQSLMSAYLPDGLKQAIHAVLWGERSSNDVLGA